MAEKTVRYWDGDNGPYEVAVTEDVAEEFARQHGGEVVTDDVSEDVPAVIEVDDIPPATPPVIDVQDIPAGGSESPIYDQFTTSVN